MRRRGFTLVELMMVIVIIGILVAFILKAAVGGIRRAEEKGTIALIAKLEQAMTDRMDALATYRPDPTPVHQAMAAIYNSKSLESDGTTVKPIPSVQRAQAIAQFDYIRAQLPDVFVVAEAPDDTNKGVYPLNFAGSAAVPLLANNAGNGTVTGWNGAAFEIAGGIYKQLGYHAKGYNGNDDNYDGYTDDSLEGYGSLTAAEQKLVTDRLARHTHKTARSEMLYAILVEGGGPFGSAFDKDDFTTREVQDTDGDGLMEFVDAWGEPLQFYRWPVMYHSDGQKGFPDFAKVSADNALGIVPGPYSVTKTGSVYTSYESREQNPIDPNQTLLAPAWWGSTFNDSVPTWIGTANGKVSGAAMGFGAAFIPLVDPMAATGTTASAAAWDRSTDVTTGYYLRRAYYSRPLILSGGPDKIPGTAQLEVSYGSLDDRSQFPLTDGSYVAKRDSSGGALTSKNVTNLLIESQGGRIDLNRTGLFGAASYGTGYRNDTNTFLEYASEDDITSHNLQTTGGVLQ